MITMYIDFRRNNSFMKARSIENYGSFQSCLLEIKGLKFDTVLIHLKSSNNYNKEYLGIWRWRDPWKGNRNQGQEDLRMQTTMPIAGWLTDVCVHEVREEVGQSNGPASKTQRNTLYVSNCFDLPLNWFKPNLSIDLILLLTTNSPSSIFFCGFWRNYFVVKTDTVFRKRLSLLF